MNKNGINQAVYLKDYSAINYRVEKVFLHFDIFDEETFVTSELYITKFNNQDEYIELYGDKDLECVFIKLNGSEIQNIDRIGEVVKLYTEKKSNIILSIKTRIQPHKNLTLNGLYFSGGSYFTQNEPHGFRNITFFPDRPDVLTLYETKISCSKKYEHLLSNGNLLSKGTQEGHIDRHFVVWKDPYPKPSYLFALVVGNFDVLKKNYITASGRNVSCEIYVDKGKLFLIEHAMNSLFKSMKWDEEKFGLEYDLDHYMIVAAESFNMGAMENKGLNIFNSKYILGNETTATDDDLDAIESVIAHEYFHNWTGNRVTCRDWFQLTLKEGLTVFRDQWFSADQHGEVVKRIKDVQILRQKQFDEDAGPLSHPIRPESYIEMNNFYTVTVYEKGAEVVRLLKTLVGDELFIKSVKFYLNKFDGKAATVEDFIFSFEKICGIDLSIFMNWYSQRGTPQVDVSFKVNNLNPLKFKLELEQSIPGIPHPKILSLPIRISLVGSNGPVEFEVEGGKITKSILKNVGKNEALIFMQDKKVELDLISKINPSEISLSFNRNFSSPIRVIDNADFNKSHFLAQNESDPFNKWEAFQKMSLIMVEDALSNKLSLQQIKSYAEILGKELRLKNRNDYFTSMLFEMPSEDEINDTLPLYRFSEVRGSLLTIQTQIASFLKDELREEFLLLGSFISNKNWNSELMGKRKLKNILLRLLLLIEDEAALNYCLGFMNESSFNQQFNILYNCNQLNVSLKNKINDLFIAKHHGSTLIVDKWFIAQASNLKDKNLFNTILELEKSSYFDIKIPNKVYALFISWMNNLSSFNDERGDNYSWMIDKIRQVDGFNPRVASRVLKGFKSLSKLPPLPSEKLKSLLNSYLSSSTISKDCAEIVEKLLKG